MSSYGKPNNTFNPFLHHPDPNEWRIDDSRSNRDRMSETVGHHITDVVNPQPTQFHYMAPKYQSEYSPMHVLDHRSSPFSTSSSVEYLQPSPASMPAQPYSGHFANPKPSNFAAHDSSSYRNPIYPVNFRNRSHNLVSEQHEAPPLDTQPFPENSAHHHSNLRPESVSQHINLHLNKNMTIGRAYSSPLEMLSPDTAPANQATAHRSLQSNSDLHAALPPSVPSQFDSNVSVIPAIGSNPMEPTCQSPSISSATPPNTTNSSAINKQTIPTIPPSLPNNSHTVATSSSDKSNDRKLRKLRQGMEKRPVGRPPKLKTHSQTRVPVNRLPEIYELLMKRLSEPGGGEFDKYAIQGLVMSTALGDEEFGFNLDGEPKYDAFIDRCMTIIMKDDQSMYRMTNRRKNGRVHSDWSDTSRDKLVLERYEELLDSNKYRIERMYRNSEIALRYVWTRADLINFKEAFKRFGYSPTANRQIAEYIGKGMHPNHIQYFKRALKQRLGATKIRDVIDSPEYAALIDQAPAEDGKALADFIPTEAGISDPGTKYLFGSTVGGTFFGGAQSQNNAAPSKPEQAKVDAPVTKKRGRPPKIQNPDASAQLPLSPPSAHPSISSINLNELSQPGTPVSARSGYTTPLTNRSIETNSTTTQATTPNTTETSPASSSSSETPRMFGRYDNNSHLLSPPTSIYSNKNYKRSFALEHSLQSHSEAMKTLQAPATPLPPLPGPLHHSDFQSSTKVDDQLMNRFYQVDPAPISSPHLAAQTSRTTNPPPPKRHCGVIEKEIPFQPPSNSPFYPPYPKPLQTLPFDSARNPPVILDSPQTNDTYSEAMKKIMLLEKQTAELRQQLSQQHTLNQVNSTPPSQLPPREYSHPNRLIRKPLGNNPYPVAPVETLVARANEFPSHASPDPYMDSYAQARYNQVRAIAPNTLPHNNPNYRNADVGFAYRYPQTAQTYPDPTEIDSELLELDDYPQQR